MNSFSDLKITENKKGRVWFFVLIFSCLIVLFVGYLYLVKDPFGVKIDKNQRQAVFLTNGQIYFGHIEKNSGSYLVLSDIYYLKSETTSESEQNSIKLVKLGEEIHGPEDKMYINKTHVLFYENMRDSSKINDSIKDYLNKVQEQSVGADSSKETEQ